MQNYKESYAKVMTMRVTLYTRQSVISTGIYIHTFLLIPIVVLELCLGKCSKCKIINNARRDNVGMQWRIQDLTLVDLAIFLLK